MENDAKKVVVVGAGPAGLTAAYELYKAGLGSIVLEKDRIVGGISRTIDYKIPAACQQPVPRSEVRIWRS